VAGVKSCKEKSVKLDCQERSIKLVVRKIGKAGSPEDQVKPE
jgi:hypothetical protein